MAMARNTTQPPLFPFAFDRRFLDDHAGQILTDSKVALVELVANSYDAGATHVEVRWPVGINGQFSVCDDGTGMTEHDFMRRWKTWNFNRLTDASLGPEVRFPPG